MSFTFNAYKPSTQDEFASHDLYNTVMDAYQKGVKTRYLEPDLAAELKKSELFNQYYGKNIESEIGERNANAGYLGSRTAGQNIENQYAGDKYSLANQKAEQELRNPFITTPGAAGDLLRANWLRTHTNVFGDQSGGGQGGGDQGGYALTPQQQANLQRYQQQQQPQQAPQEMNSGPYNMTTIPREGGYLSQQGMAPLQSSSYEPGVSDTSNPMRQPQSQIENGMKSGGVLNQIPNTMAQQNAAPAMQQGQPRNAYDEFLKKTIQGSQKQAQPPTLQKNLAVRDSIIKGIDPTTGDQLTKEQQIQKLTAVDNVLDNLKPGEQNIYDPDTLEKIGRKEPFTDQEKISLAGRGFFNIAYHVINSGVGVYQGKGATARLNNDIPKYGIDPAATKRLDDLKLAQNLLASGVVNEQATLNTGKTNQTYRELRKSFPQSDIGKKLIDWEQSHLLPPGYNMKGNSRTLDVINKASKYGASSVPSYKTTYNEPSKHVDPEIGNHPFEVNITKKVKQKDGSYKTETRTETRTGYQLMKGKKPVPLEILVTKMAST